MEPVDDRAIVSNDDDNDITTIIAACAGGGAVLLAIVAAIVYCKRRSICALGVTSQRTTLAQEQTVSAELRFSEHKVPSWI